LDKAIEVKSGKMGTASVLLPLVAAGVVLAGCAVAPALRERSGVTQSLPSAAAESELEDWPRIASAIAPDPAMEARIQEIVAGMTLTQKVGQMTQADISAATPEDVRRYYLGGILNGGDSQPYGARFATFAQWRELTSQYHAAALATDMPIKIPLIWGTDAVHGDGIVRGASIFPQKHKRIKSRNKI